MADDLEIFIEPDGTAIFVHDDDVAAIVFSGEALATARASHVEPSGTGWTADLSPVGGPVLGPYARRDTALAQERAWLVQRLAEGTLNR